MRYNNEPSRLRKSVMTVAAGIAAIGLFILFFASSYLFLPPEPLESKGPTAITDSQSDSNLSMSHGHAELTVSVNGKTLDLSGPEYQNRNIGIHLEDNDGSTLHIHDRSAWIGLFLESIGMSLKDNCLKIPNGTSYCSNFDNQVVFLVNGNVNGEFQHYTPKSEDKILISYGSKEAIKTN